MTLQTKFAILLLALAAAVVLALGTARWALDVTYREVREPVQSSSNVLKLLVDIERHIDELRAAADPGNTFSPEPLDPGSPPPPHHLFDLATFRRRSSAIQVLLHTIDAEPWTRFAGKSATRTLNDKIAEFDAHAAAFFDSQDFPDNAAAGLPRIRSQLFQIHELLKLLENRVVVDLQKATENATDLRSRLTVVLGLSLLIVALTAGLGFLLARRWVVRPVAALRTAAARIAAGDFEHRIPIDPNAPRDEMTALSDEVNHMSAMVKQLQAERIERERLAAIGGMVQRLAHNLRNPMSGIRNLAELSRDDAKALGPPADELRDAQVRIIKSVDRFESWLTELLNVTKPMHVAPHSQPIHPWLAGLVEAHLPMAKGCGVMLALDTQTGPQVAPFDARHLEHAVSAIVANGIQAAASNKNSLDKTQTVRIMTGSNDPKTWFIKIEDTGAGIAPEHLPQLFTPYFTTKQDGNGIGLATAQQIVRAHGGEISVEESTLRVEPPNSGPSEGPHTTRPGAAFVLRLPLATKSGPAG